MSDKKLKPLSHKELTEYLEKHNLGYEVNSLESAAKVRIPEGYVYDITINGDWRHDHQACDLLMKDIGYTKIAELPTEEITCDAFEAIHRYAFTSWYNEMKKK